jgi:hypothetical protein
MPIGSSTFLIRSSSVSVLLVSALLFACGGDETVAQPITAGGSATSMAGAFAAGAAGSTAGTSAAGMGAAGSSIATAGRSGAAGTGFGSRGPAGSGAAGAAVGGAAGRSEAGRGAAVSGMGGSGAAGTISAGSGGSSGVAGSGGSSASTEFKPCPATGACKILPLGDSITDGIGFSGGYRVQLFHLAVMNMKNVTFVGSKMNGPMTVDGMPFPPKHEGTSGITIGGLDGRIPMPGLNEIPHIVLLHIGTNDMYMSPAGAADRLATLIDGIVTTAPDALVVVAKIIPLSSGASAVATYNEAIPAVVQKQIDAKKHVILIDQFTGFPTSELGDGVHPNMAGYSRMAEKWYAAISSYLN